jgi:hypothetical protein
VPRNCRFLQGAHTDRQPVQRLKAAIAEEKESVELLLNYKKNGDPFWNLLYVGELHTVSLNPALSTAHKTTSGNPSVSNLEPGRSTTVQPARKGRVLYWRPGELLYNNPQQC